MARLAFTVLCAMAALLLPGNAFAGDVPSLNLLGFSEDGGIFAFEEYGIQDGSGFPYARRFYVDTASDRFVAGTPIRVRLDDEGAGLEKARAQARSQGEAIAPDAVLSRHRGYIAGWNAITERSADPHAMHVLPRPIFPSPDKPLDLRLEEFVLPVDSECMGQGDTMGFRLVRMKRGDGEPVVLHEDKSIPASRHCPLGYSIAGILTYYPEGGAPVFVVMVAIRGVGFEGPDYNWITITGRL